MAEGGTPPAITCEVLVGDCRDVLRTLPEKTFRCCVTSPPYLGLREYGQRTWIGGDLSCKHRYSNARRDHTHGKMLETRGEQARGRESARVMRSTCSKCGAVAEPDQQIGLEGTVQEYISALIQVFREVRRVLTDDGTLWLNLGDSYSGGNAVTTDGLNERWHGKEFRTNKQGETDTQKPPRRGRAGEGFKRKDKLFLPHRVAIALQDDGWWVRQDNVWCLSGGTNVYAKTVGHDVILTSVKDLYRIRDHDVRLWNGQAWTRMLGMSISPRRGDEIEFTLRSGERISCTPAHQFPTQRGLVVASEIRSGDSLLRCRLPEPSAPLDSASISVDAAWFAGAYLANGSMSGETIQIAAHAKHDERWRRLSMIAKLYGGSITRTIDGNKMDIRMYGRFLRSIIAEFVSGKVAKDKGISEYVWRYSDSFVQSFMDGYLEGDGHYDAENERWRIGFTRNYTLERDMRVACARLGWHLVLKMATAKIGDREFPAFRGEIRKSRSGHPNQQNPNEVDSIAFARARRFYDIGVEDEPHLFALASGILTHNSKPNALPEAVRDRSTCAHEYVFQLSKSKDYFYNTAEAREAVTGNAHPRGSGVHPKALDGMQPARVRANSSFSSAINEIVAEDRNMRSVWSIPTEPLKEKHFAAFPRELARRCIAAGSAQGDHVLDCFSGAGTTLMVASGMSRSATGIELMKSYAEMSAQRIGFMCRVREPDMTPPKKASRKRRPARGIQGGRAGDALPD